MVRRVENTPEGNRRRDGPTLEDIAFLPRRLPLELLSVTPEKWCCAEKREKGQGNAPGTPGKRLAEKTVKDSVNVWARIGVDAVMTRFAPGSGAGELF